MTRASDFPCPIAGCRNFQRARGYCTTHLLRLALYGDPNTLSIRKMMTPSQLFWSRVTGGDIGTCWEWQGAITAAGYGAHMGAGAHRFAYEDIVGPIPDGLQLDHLCNNKACVNPWHLEPVTPLVNTHRMMIHTGTGIGATHCPSGHEYTVANIQPKAGNRRGCRACARNYATRKREERAA